MTKYTYEIKREIVSKVEIIADTEEQALKRLRDRVAFGQLTGEERFAPPRKIKEEKLY